MDHKTLVNRFTKACCLFEAIQEDIDILLVDTDNEIKCYEYEGLASQAAEIVLKLSANGKNVGMNFYNYYLCRLEYIIAYFRALLDYEETPLAEDEPNELSDAPGEEVGFEGLPADCAFPPPPPFVFKKWEFKSTPTAKDEENAATDEAGAVEETADEDTPPTELDNENDAQAAESDEATDDTAAGAPLSPCKKPFGLLSFLGLNRLSSEDRERVRDTFVMWYDINEVIGRNPEDPNLFPAAEILEFKENAFSEFEYDMEFGKEHLILVDEQEIRAAIEDAIDAIPGFRDSEKFKNLIELCPSYKEIKQ